MNSEFQIRTLPNGIRVVIKNIPTTKIVHCGFTLDIGSRDESPEQYGIAHFWEHMAFKGTKRRKAFHIINKLEAVGGELNAYTTKENICFYASVLDKFVESAIDLLTDITFDSIFPEKQLEKERGVILEEMAMYRDAPEDAIVDEFDEVIFGDHELGHNILGTDERVKNFTRKDFTDFIGQHLSSDRIIFSIVGSISEKQIDRLLAKYLAPIPQLSNVANRSPFVNYSPQIITKHRSLTQGQVAVGRTAYELMHPNRIPFFLLVNIFGGPGLNSRLNLAIREKYGFVYSIDAGYQNFKDVGLFSILFGTAPKQVDRAIQLVFKEMKLLREKPLGSLQMLRAKEQLKGQMAMSEENNLSLMLMTGRSLLNRGDIPLIDNLFKDIDKITPSKLQEVSQDIFMESDMSILSYLPEA